MSILVQVITGFLLPLALEVAKRMIPEKLSKKREFDSGKRMKNRITKAQENLKRWNESGKTIDDLSKKRWEG